MDLQALHSVPLFQTLGSREMAELFRLLTTRQIPTGTALFRRDDPGDAMFFIESGRIRISVQDTDGHDTSLAELGVGEFFGEMAMLDGQNRSADAIALEETNLAVLKRDDFRALVRRDPEVALGLLTAMTHRLRRTDNLLRHRVSRNINEIEASHLSLADRAADLIAEFGGSWKFIGSAIGLVIVWIVVNSWLLFTHSFDPFPYVLLNLVLGMIAGLQAPIIMMSQNRQGEKDRLRADLDYRVNLKNELLLTEVLRRLENLEGSRSHLPPADPVEEDLVRRD
jgi:CRP/FNR family transcriptional regulator, cyclic AMP receptor protein